MTPAEWLEGWRWFQEHDDPIYVSEHRRGFTVDYEMEDEIEGKADITLIAISAALALAACNGAGEEPRSHIH